MRSESTLTLFRRHESACTEGYYKSRGKDFRIHPTDSSRNGKPQCNCMIYGEGTLRRDGQKKYVKATKTDRRSWDEAQRVLDQWIRWFGTAPPVVVEIPMRPSPSPDTYRLTTVVEFVEQFYEYQKDRCDEERMREYRHLLSLRLLPFVAAMPEITFIQ